MLSITLNVRRALLALGCAALAGCSSDSNSPVAPVGRPTLEVVDPAVVANGLTWRNTLREPMWGFAMIGPDGGELVIKATGLKLKVPAGAVSTPTLFTAVAIPGDVVAYDFGPHGSVFARPLQVKQSLKGTEWSHLRDTHVNIEAGYFRTTSQIDQLTDQVLVNEFLPAELDLHVENITFNVSHFSGYMLSTGRSQAPRM